MAGVKTALKASVPTGNVLVDSCAVPPETLTGAPSATPPTSNWTVPEADGLTVAVSVTEVPAVWGLVGAAVSTVLVAFSVGVGFFVINAHFCKGLFFVNRRSNCRFVRARHFLCFQFVQFFFSQFDVMLQGRPG